MRRAVFAGGVGGAVGPYEPRRARCRGPVSGPGAAGRHLYGAPESCVPPDPSRCRYSGYQWAPDTPGTARVVSASVLTAGTRPGRR